jgi:hypothetical protein
LYLELQRLDAENKMLRDEVQKLKMTIAFDEARQRVDGFCDDGFIRFASNDIDG